MIIIFCSSPLNAREIDPDFAHEYSCAIHCGFDVGLLNFENLIDHEDWPKAVKRIQAKEAPIAGIYRGWMLKPGQYEKLYKLLNEKNIRLINSPEAYQTCHYLPESYPYIKGHTPTSHWLQCGSND